MTNLCHGRGVRRWIALVLVAGLLAPLALVPAAAVRAQGMSTRKKVVLLAGAALLYYLYRRHQATRARTTSATATPGKTAQLYRSRNGGIYYRDPQGKPVWLTVPSGGVQVPRSDLRRYAPDYYRHRGPAPTVPNGDSTQTFSDFDPSLTPGPA